MLVLAVLASAGLAHAEEVLPSAIGRLDILTDKLAGWSGSVIIIDTPESNDNLKVAIVPMTGEAAIVNEGLLAKQTTPGFETLANVYNVSVTATQTGGVKVSNWRDMGTSNWSTAYTIVKKNGKFVIAGVDQSYSYREAHGSCSMNLLTGQASVNHKPATRVSAPQLIEFKTSTEPQVLDVCNKLLKL